MYLPYYVVTITSLLADVPHVPGMNFATDRVPRLLIFSLVFVPITGLEAAPPLQKVNAPPCHASKCLDGIV